VLLEVKKSDDSPASSLKYFQEVFPVAEAFQLVETLRQPQSFGKLHVVSAAEWLTSNLAV
jgi:hypothetical protein